VPLTAAGNLTVVASAELGALGAKSGSPVNYLWVLPSVAPQVLPWLILLGLLALKPNRRAAAWLIWLPVGCVLAVTLLPPMMPSGADFLLDVVAALAFGLAAVWLLSNYLRQSHRLLTFFCVLPTLAGFSLLAAVAKQGRDLLDSDALQVGILLGVSALTSTVALSVAGWICRGRYRPLGLYPWLFVSVLGVWLAVAAPFFFFAVVASGGNLALNSWNEFFIPVLAMAAANFALLLPFLILSSASPLYRERLKALLNVKPAAPPVLPNAAP